MNKFTLENVPKQLINLLTPEEIGLLFNLLMHDENNHKHFESWASCEDTFRMAQACYYLIKPYFKEV